MDAFRLSGNGPLDGAVDISGAKNAVLPMMASALLAEGISEITNAPHLKDMKTMSDLLRVIGCRVFGGKNQLLVDTTGADHLEAPYELVKTMRASFYVLGPLLARFGRARVSLPGGCAWGPRPVDLHLKGFEALGAKVVVTHGYVETTAEKLRGANITFPISSVGATANVLMAATLAEGTTVINNAAVEPEIDATVDYLLSMGAQIEGRGSRTLTITGVEKLQPGKGATIPDRIEAGTFLAAGLISRGRVRVNKVDPQHLEAVLEVFREIGAQVSVGSDWVELDARDSDLQAVSIKAIPYPGFPTDMQAQLMSVLTTVPGISVIQDTIYNDRFMHVSELKRLGAKIELQGDTATIHGGSSLTGAPVMASDLRASAAMVLAGLVASSTTEISRIYHLDRGYENFEQKLQQLGGKIERFVEQ
ncbi:MAG: UDP-N-acetylglucosamine 1-carboxyvinyltransferase [Fibrobacter sp.]|nr:UDP-N-acetylglucosamine 1-carboxyvinyltransferase [Fibrobacter sp.]